MLKDRFLLAIIGVIILLVSIGLWVVMRQPVREYLAEDSASATAHNYLLALELKDYSRAYTYLPATLPGYPRRESLFASQVGGFPDGMSWKIIEETPINATGSLVVVRGELMIFSRSGLFFSSTRSQWFKMRWLKGPDGWRLLNAEGFYTHYFFPQCWAALEGCSP